MTYIQVGDRELNDGGTGGDRLRHGTMSLGAPGSVYAVDTGSSTTTELICRRATSARRSLQTTDAPSIGIAAPCLDTLMRGTRFS